MVDYIIGPSFHFAKCEIKFLYIEDLVGKYDLQQFISTVCKISDHNLITCVLCLNVEFEEC